MSCVICRNAMLREERDAPLGENKRLREALDERHERYVILEGVPNNATVHAFSVYDSEIDDYVDDGYALTLAEAKALLARLDECAAEREEKR